jgi:hypothetical protein
MGNLWLKIKIWTKSILLGALLIYAIIFFLENSGQPVEFWYWYNQKHPSSMLVMMLLAFAAGVISTILVKTTLTTLRQIRELRNRNRIDRLERAQAEMKVKAARLQTMTATPVVNNDETRNPNDESMTKSE